MTIEKIGLAATKTTAVLAVMQPRLPLGPDQPPQRLHDRRLAGHALICRGGLGLGQRLAA